MIRIYGIVNKFLIIKSMFILENYMCIRFRIDRRLDGLKYGLKPIMLQYVLYFSSCWVHLSICESGPKIFLLYILF